MHTLTQFMFLSSSRFRFNETRGIAKSSDSRRLSATRCPDSTGGSSKWNGGISNGVSRDASGKVLRPVRSVNHAMFENLVIECQVSVFIAKYDTGEIFSSPPWAAGLPIRA